MIRLLFLSFLCCLPVAQAWADSAPVPVIVSIAPQKYILERIAGDDVAVTVLVIPGADPHVYEPSPSQMRAVQEAGVWFTIGVPFEDVWLPRITGTAPNLKTISMLKGISRLHFADNDRALTDFLLERGLKRDIPQTLAAAEAEEHEHEHEEGLEQGHEHEQGHEPGHGHGHEHASGEDPHVWLSPMLVRQMLPETARNLARLRPEKAAVYRANAQAFADELEALDRELAEKFAPVPKERRVFLTFHPSWHYYAHSYQLTELSIEVEGKEPGARSMKAIMDLAKALDIRTVFVEPQFPKAAAQSIAGHIGAVVVEANPLAEDLPALYRDMAAKLITSFNR